MSTTEPVQVIKDEHRRSAGVAGDVDYRIVGRDTQFVEIELDPGESAIAEAGALIFKDTAVAMDAIFGDGSKTNSSFLSKVAAAGRRLVTGESLFMTLFTHQGLGKARVAFAAPYPGSILPFKLSSFGGALIAQSDAFLCATNDVTVGIHLQRKVMTGLFGREGFIMQRLEGEGWVFIHVGGCLVERGLADGEELHVDMGCIAAMTPTIDLDIVRAGPVKSLSPGRDGMFLAHLKGPGRLWLQSHPLSRLAGRVVPAAPFSPQK
jgi:uncharacterized protein (AIM24 family)